MATSVPDNFERQLLRSSILTLFLFSALTAVVAQNETLDNRIVIDMSKAGLSAELIVRKISTSQTAFDVSANGTIDLKKSGVDDVVIGAMIERTEGRMRRGAQGEGGSRNAGAACPSTAALLKFATPVPQGGCCSTARNSTQQYINQVKKV